jgi:uncharacterized membrane protein
VKSSGKRGDISLMRIIEEFKRMKTIEFWQQVKYWSVPKWSTRKKFSDPVRKENWLPIITSTIMGVMLVIIINLFWGLIKGK